MSISLKKLYDQTIIQDQIRLPDYQREYVWSGDQQKSLIASFLNATPLGAILLFKGTRGGEDTSFMAKGLGRVKKTMPFTPSNSEVEYLLDGQQRVTTLINTLFDLYRGVDESIIDEMLYVGNYNDNTLYRELHRRWFIDLKEDEAQHFGYESLSFDPERLALSAESLAMETTSILTSRTLNQIKNDPPAYHPKASQADLRSYCIENKLIPLFLCGSDPIELFNILEGIQAKHADATLASESAWREELHQFLTDTIIHGDEGDPDADELASYYTLQTERVGMKRLNRAFFTFEKRNHAGEALKPFDLISAKGAVAFYRLDHGGNYTNLQSVDFTANLSVKIKRVLTDELNLTWDELKRVGIFDQRNQLSSTFKNYFVQLLSVYGVHLDQGEGSISPNHTKAGWMISRISSKDVADHYHHITASICRALRFANEALKVYKLTELPFRPMFLPLSFIHAVIPEAELDASNQELLTAWFWGTMFSLEYGKDASTAAAKDCNDLLQLLTDRTLSPRFEDRVRQVTHRDELLGYNESILQALTLNGGAVDNRTSHEKVICMYSRYRVTTQAPQPLKDIKTRILPNQRSHSIYNHPLNWRTNDEVVEVNITNYEDNARLINTYFISRLRELKVLVMSEVQPLSDLIQVVAQVGA